MKLTWVSVKARMGNRGTELWECEESGWECGESGWGSSDLFIYTFILKKQEKGFTKS